MPGLLQRIFGRKEERLAPAGWVIGQPLYAHTGSPVSPHMAESLAAVTSCVGLIADSIASLPASLTVDTPTGRAPAPTTAAAWRVLERPNSHQSWPAFVSWLVSSVLLYGNAVARVDTDGRGAVTGLTPAPWRWLLPQAFRSAGGGSTRLVFDVTHRTPESDALGLTSQRL